MLYYTRQAMFPRLLLLQMVLHLKQIGKLVLVLKIYHFEKQTPELGFTVLNKKV